MIIDINHIEYSTKSKTLMCDQRPILDFPDNSIIKFKSNYYYLIKNYHSINIETEIEKTFYKFKINKINLVSNDIHDLCNVIKSTNILSKNLIWSTLYANADDVRNVCDQKLKAFDQFNNHGTNLHNFNVQKQTMPIAPSLKEYLTSKWIQDHDSKYLENVSTEIKKYCSKMYQDLLENDSHFVANHMDKIVGHFVLSFGHDSLIDQENLAVHIWSNSTLSNNYKKLFHNIFFKTCCNSLDNKKNRILHASILIANSPSYNYFVKNAFVPTCICIKK